MSGDYDNGLVTDHFSLQEFGLADNDVATLDPADVMRMRGSARILASEVLEPLRVKFGAIKLTDGFRDQEHNAAVGGKKVSYHLYEDGHAAADLWPFAMNFGDVFDWIRLVSGLPFDKVILECHPASVAELESVASLLNAPVPVATKFALENHALTPRCIHVQLDVNAAPRRLAYIGFTGNGDLYKPVPVGKVVLPDAT